MSRRLLGWFSPALQREMPLAAFGDRGRPLLLFPTAGGDYLECERFKLIEVIRPLIEAGQIRVYTCGSVSGEGWLSNDAHPGHKAWLQACFDRYVAEEVVPFVRGEVGDPGARLIAAGASIGAYNAVNAHLKHPELFWLTIAMSGTYDLDRWMGDHRDETYYYNAPFHYLPGIGEGSQLEWLQRGMFYIASGQGRWEAPWESARLGGLLGAKRIPNFVDLWGKEIDHDWPTWRTMLPHFLDKLLA